MLGEGSDLYSLIWLYLDIYLNIAILYRIFPRFQKCIRKFNPTLFHWTTGFFFFKKDLADFLKIFPRIFKGPFLHRKTYSLKYWTRLPSIGQSVSPSVCQSISPSIGICNPFLNSLNRHWVPDLFIKQTIRLYCFCIKVVFWNVSIFLKSCRTMHSLCWVLQIGSVEDIFIFFFDIHTKGNKYYDGFYRNWTIRAYVIWQ